MSKNTILILILVVLLMSIISCGGSSTGVVTPDTQYQIATHRGVIYFIVVDAVFNSNRVGLENIGTSICSAEKICQVWYFNDWGTAIAASSAMDTAQPIAIYEINRNTGYKEMLVCTLGDC
jgi:hypothetical protein